MPGQPVLIAFSFGLFGFFAFALMPVCLEVGVECTYPVAEATSAGLQWMAGYAVVMYEAVCCVCLTVRFAFPKHIQETCVKRSRNSSFNYT